MKRFMGRPMYVTRNGEFRTADARFPVIIFGPCVPDVGGWVGCVTFKTPGIAFAPRRGRTLEQVANIVRRDLLKLKAELGGSR